MQHMTPTCSILLVMSLLLHSSVVPTPLHTLLYIPHIKIICTNAMHCCFLLLHVFQIWCQSQRLCMVVGAFLLLNASGSTFRCHCSSSQFILCISFCLPNAPPLSDYFARLSTIFLSLLFHVELDFASAHERYIFKL